MEKQENNWHFSLTIILLLLVAMVFSSYGSELTGRSIQIAGPQTTLLRSCGNGVIQLSETCDDGNKVNGDGCSLSCKIENGWTCSGQPSVCTFPITIGEKNILTGDDNGNGNLMVAMQTTLPQSAAIKSLSFYVAQASGKLRLGIYDATGPSGGPGAKKAETNEITPVVGWNTATVVTSVSLASGNYWLAYLPSDNNLHFRMEPTGNAKWYTYTYGVMPATFSTTPLGGAYHWSFYATLNAGGSPPVFDFSLSNAGDKIVVNGGSVTNVITATLVSGIPQSVSYSVSGLPSGVTGSFSPTSCSPLCSTTLTLSAAASVSPSTSSILVTGTAGSISHTTSFSLTVNQPSVCGNGIITTGETCDDANTNSGDGCSSTCTIETGWTCSGQPSVCEQNEGGYGSIGTNLDGVTYFSGQIIWKDLAKGMMPWNQGSCDPSLLDAQGWPKSVPFPGGASCGIAGAGTADKPNTLMGRDDGWHIPSGAYTLIFDGTGSIQTDFAAENKACVSTGPTTTCTINVIPNSVGIRLIITSSSASDHIRNIRFIMPGSENGQPFTSNYQSQPFNPIFLSRLQNFKVLRFLDTLNVNNDNTVLWQNRRLSDYYTQSSSDNFQSGMAYEWMVDIVNAVPGADLWVNVPYVADDTYVQNLATLILGRLNSDRKVYLEYSNEVWNSIFSAHKYAWDQGVALGFEPQSGEQGNTLKFQVIRSNQVFKIVRQVFGNQSSRVVNVLGRQSVDSYWTDEMLSWQTTPIVNVSGQSVNLNPTNEKVNSVAIAPYIAGAALNLGPGATVQQVLDALDADITKDVQDIQAQKIVTNKYGVDLITYEGGLHLYGVNYADPPPAFIAATHDPAMKPLYTKYLHAMFDNGIQIFVQYKNIYNDAYYNWKSGMWGLLEWQDQQPCVSTASNPLAPRYQAIQEAMGQDPCV